MKITLAGLAAVVVLAASTNVASAQVAARYTYDGRAVCPSGYDYRDGACWARGGYGDQGFRRSYGYQQDQGGGGRIVRPQFDPTGSAICPENFDYARGACRSRY